MLEFLLPHSNKASTWGGCCPTVNWNGIFGQGNSPAVIVMGHFWPGGCPEFNTFPWPGRGSCMDPNGTLHPGRGGCRAFQGYITSIRASSFAQTVPFGGSIDPQALSCCFSLTGATCLRRGPDYGGATSQPGRILHSRTAAASRTSSPYNSNLVQSSLA